MHELLDEHERRTSLSQRRRQEEYERRQYLERQEFERGVMNFCLAAVNAVSRPASPAPLAGTKIGHTSNIQPQQQLVLLMTPHDLVRLLGVPDILAADLQRLEEKRKVQVPEPEQARAEQLIRTKQIREWLTSPISSQLLIHGNYDHRAYISGLSLFCKSLTDTLSERAPRFIPLTFFCGLHTEPLLVAHTGGRGLIQSFLYQLLRHGEFHQHPSGGIPVPKAALDDIQDGDIDTLCNLFVTLVHMLPNTVTLFCIIDGVLYYERPEFVHDMEKVLMVILQLSNDDGRGIVQAPVKVLLTSPTRTRVVRAPFPDELILSMEGMARAGLVASSSRLKRETGSELV